MKLNKWTLGLAAVGVVSLASAVKAEEKAPTFLETAVSGTQISGYVNTSAHWNFNNGGIDGDTTLSRPTKANGFNLDAVQINISKSLDETEWASGYNVQLVYGQDLNQVGSAGGTGNNVNDHVSVKQAYVTLRTPVGNGIDWKIGVWDTILGYEVFEAGNNPNYSRSYGYNMEPTTYTGVLASYKFCNVVSASAGVANTAGGYGLGTRAHIDSRKAYMGSIALTAPESWGFLAGSTLYGAAVYGERSSSSSSGPANNQINYYAGVVLNTGVKGLKVGAAYDYVGTDNGTSSGLGTSWQNAAAIYASFQATEKLSVHARAEYAWSDVNNTVVSQNGESRSVYAITGTVQYDLWKNVLSRAEIRWDHATQGAYSSSSNKDAILLAANIIYKF